MNVGTPVWYLDDGGSGWRHAQVESNDNLDLVLKCDSGSTINRKGKRMTDGGVKFDGVEKAFTPLFQVPENTVLDMPKDMEEGTTLVWTSQADALTNEVSARKGEKQFADNFFVLSGPTGIGKSCIALSVALRLRAMGEVVLYAGALLVRAQEGVVEGASLTRSILKHLLFLFKKQNPSISIDEKSITTQSAFIEKLDELGGIVIIDEQGHAYVKLLDLPLTPEPYAIYGKGVRLVITSPNPETFEVSLNSSYTYCR